MNDKYDLLDPWPWAWNSSSCLLELFAKIKNKKVYHEYDLYSLLYQRLILLSLFKNGFVQWIKFIGYCGLKIRISHYSVYLG